MFRIALVEDDPSFREIISGYVKRFASENSLSLEVDCFTNGKEFLDSYHSNYNAIFMDVEMPLMNGLETAREIRKKQDDVPIMFLTNMAQYAINGYEVSAIDYVIKPVKYVTFTEKIKKAMRFGNRLIDYDITLSQKTGKVRLQTSEITYIEVMSHKLTFHTTQGNVECTGNLTKMEKELEKHYFSRCNSCFLVNLRYVTSIAKDMVEVRGEQIPISRSRKKPFMMDLASYRGGH